MARLAFLAAALGTSVLGNQQALDDKLMRRESVATVSEHFGQQPKGVVAEQPTTVEEKPKPVPPTSSTAYADAVMDSDPVAFWTMGDVGGGRSHGKGRACGQPNGLKFGDPCQVDGQILGAPKLKSGLVPSNRASKAMEFSGADNEEVLIPDNELINVDALGYTARTVELWFQSGSPGTINRTIYCEGNEAHSGLNMYVKEDDEGKLRLYMFAWDRGNHDSEFGTTLINPDPISCPIKKDTPYYVAMEFNAPEGKAASFTGYIKAPNSGAELALCGQLTDIPVDVRLRHHGHGGGNAIIGGIHTTSRASGTVQMLGTSHNFKGSVNDVALYNRALPKEELLKHYNAANEGVEQVVPPGPSAPSAPSAQAEPSVPSEPSAPSAPSGQEAAQTAPTQP